MNFLVILLIFILNAGGIGLIYLMVKDKTQMQRIIYIAVSFTIMYLISMLVYVIAAIGIDGVNTTFYRTNTVLIIAPINMLATIPLLISSYKNMKSKKISFNKFSNNVTISIVVLLVLCVCEIFAIKLFLKKNNEEVKRNYVVIEENNSVAGELTRDLLNELSENTNSNITSNSVNESLNSQVTNELSNVIDNNLNTEDNNSEENNLSNSLNSENATSSENESRVSNVETNPNGIGILVN